MPKPTRRVPDDPGKPSPGEALAKARAAAGPRVAKAVEAATPKVEKAALSAGKLLGTLRDRAKITAKEFADAYKVEDEDDAAAGPASDAKPAASPTAKPAAKPTGKPRPRPRPSKD